MKQRYNHLAKRHTHFGRTAILLHTTSSEERLDLRETGAEVNPLQYTSDFRDANIGKLHWGFSKSGR